LARIVLSVKDGGAKPGGDQRNLGGFWLRGGKMNLCFRVLQATNVFFAPIYQCPTRFARLLVLGRRLGSVVGKGGSERN